VEGANTLTRSLIIFGQGVTRSHPHLYDIMRTLEAKDDPKGFARELQNMVTHGVSTSLTSMGTPHGTRARGGRRMRAHTRTRDHWPSSAPRAPLPRSRSACVPAPPAVFARSRTPALTHTQAAPSRHRSRR
jgi:hypothetical protein